MQELERLQVLSTIARRAQKGGLLDTDEAITVAQAVHSAEARIREIYAEREAAQKLAPPAPEPTAAPPAPVKN